MLDLSQIENLYAEMSKKHDLARQNLGRSLTLSEKILFGPKAVFPTSIPNSKEDVQIRVLTVPLR